MFLASLGERLLVSFNGWVYQVATWVSLFFSHYLFPSVSALAQRHPILVLVLVVFAAYRAFVYLFPLGGTVVSFSDLTANPNTATAANRSLTAELVHLLEDPEPVAVGGLQMNIWPGAGQPAKRRVIENLQRRARGLGFTLVGNPEETGGVS